MDVCKLTALPEFQQLADVVDDALHLLDADRVETKMPVPADHIQPSLFEQCIELCRQGAIRREEPIRTIHHLSCSGGTLITKCLAAMPNVFVLNEVDPLSGMTFNADKPAFTPTDMLALVRQGNQKVAEDLLIRLFLQNLKLLRSEFAMTGKRLLLRDHSHSHFLTGPEISQRPSVRAMLNPQFPTASIVTVRDPVDSYLSMQKSGWQHFSPNTFDEYCRRYLIFLDAYEDIALFRYEDFVDDPAAVLTKMCAMLDLSYTASFADTFDTFKFSGDSGRTGLQIEPRPRRALGEDFIKEAQASKHYHQLNARLGYEPLSLSHPTITKALI